MRRSVALVLAIGLLVGGVVGYVGGSRRALAPAGALAADDCAIFAQTGKQVCGRFLQYWQQNGGLRQQGLPLSDAFNEVSAADGQSYLVQYFERAVFEHHPRSLPPNDVQLSLLGREKYLAKYPGGEPGAAPQAPAPTAAPAPQPSPPLTPPPGARPGP